MTYQRPKDERERVFNGIDRVVEAYVKAPPNHQSRAKAIGEVLRQIRQERAAEETKKEKAP